MGPLETSSPELEPEFVNPSVHITESSVELPSPSVSNAELYDPLTSETELHHDPCAFKAPQFSTSQPELSVSIRVYIYSTCIYSLIPMCGGGGGEKHLVSTVSTSAYM